MIVVEEINGFRVTKSDSNYKIKKVGTEEVYYEAWDLIDSVYTYEETDEQIEVRDINEDDNILL